MTVQRNQARQSKGCILVVDDEEIVRKALQRFLKQEGYDVILAHDGKKGLARFHEGGVDLALVDLMMPEVSGKDVVAAMKKQDPDAIAIIMTAFGTISSAVEAIRAGAYHFVTKPFELDDLQTIIEKALELPHLKRENIELKKKLAGRSHLEQLVGQSRQMQSVFELISKVAEADSTVLILGESGTGKELIANAVHEQSVRHKNLLVTVNCAAMPEGLLESEFFGHVKGAFTGAVGNREGRFAQADEGTIFLDEIADMSPKLQVKILRVLQERRFEPVGSNQVREVNVRIIAATNRNLEKMVQEGTFREDLYYRLHVIPIEVPPLRKRVSDIPLLIQYFLEKFSAQNNMSVPEISTEAKKRLIEYPWPGNVRELENMVERLMVLNPNGHIDINDLPSSLLGDTSPTASTALEIPEDGLSFKEVVGRFERDLLLTALKKTEWNKNQAANLLHMNRTTLIEKIKKQGIERSH